MVAKSLASLWIQIYSPSRCFPESCQTRGLCAANSAENITGRTLSCMMCESRYNNNRVLVPPGPSSIVWFLCKMARTNCFRDNLTLRFIGKWYIWHYKMLKNWEMAWSFWDLASTLMLIYIFSLCLHAVRWRVRCWVPHIQTMLYWFNMIGIIVSLCFYTVRYFSCQANSLLSMTIGFRVA